MGKDRQKKIVKAMAANGGKKTSLKQGMIDAGYSENYARQSQRVKSSKSWNELMDEYLSEDSLTQAHQALLNATTIGHMVFPLSATDDQIKELLAEANCIPKRFMHGDTQTHVWFFAADNNARKNALDMAYKLRGHYAPEQIKHSLDEESIDAEIARVRAEIKNLGTPETEDTPE